MFTHPRDAEDDHRWQTRAGRPARILCHDLAGAKYVIAAAVQVGAREEVFTYTSAGVWNINKPDNSKDLIDAPRTRTVWVNMYGTSMAGVHDSKDVADRVAYTTVGARTACLEITYTDGEGL